MADIGRWTGASVGSLVPTGAWSSPNGMFPTEDLNPSSIYGWASSTSRATLPSSDLADGYLLIGSFEYEDSSNGRFAPEIRIQRVSGTGTFIKAHTTGYNRDNSEDRAYARCWAFVDNPSASSVFSFDWIKDSDGPNSTDGIVRSEFVVIPFYYSDIGMYSAGDGGLNGGTTPNQVTGFTGTDGTNITLTSDVVTLAGNNKRYLMLGSDEGFGATARTQRWTGFDIDGSPEHAAKTYYYARNSLNERAGGMFTHLLETATADVAVEMFKYRGDGVTAFDGGADVDGDSFSFPIQNMVFIELNDTAEVYASKDVSGNQELAVTGPVDINIANSETFSDAASFVKVNQRTVNVEKACDVLFGANIGAAQGTVSTTQRWTGHAEVTKDGVEDTTHGFHGNYQRNENGSEDTYGWAANPFGVLDFAADEDFGISVQELTGTEGGGGNVETQAGWVGAWLINLDTLRDRTVEPTSVAVPMSAPTPSVAIASLSLSPDATGTPLLAAAPTLGLGTLTVSPDATPMPLAAAAPTLVLGTLGLTPDAAAMPVVAVTPSLGLGALDITPDVSPVPLVAAVPSIGLGELGIAPDAAAVPLSAPNPTVALGVFDLSPDANPVALAVPNPAIALGALTLTPDVAPVPVVGVAPAIGLGALVMTPDAMSVPLSIPDPAVAVPVGLTPDATAVPISIPTLALGLDLGLSPGSTAVPLSAPSVAITIGGGDLELTPDPMAVPVAVPTPTMGLGTLNITPDAGTVPVVAANPSLGLSLLLSPDAAAITMSSPDPAINLSLGLSPAATAIPIAAGSPTIALGALTLSPDATGPLMSAPSVSVALGVLAVTPDPASVVLSVPDPARSGLLSLAPDVTAVSIGAPDPAVALSLGLTPDATAVLLGIPVPAITRLLIVGSVALAASMLGTVTLSMEDLSGVTMDASAIGDATLALAQNGNVILTVSQAGTVTLEAAPA